MSDEIMDIPKVAIRPIDCLIEAKELIGKQYWLFVGICAVGMILGSIVPFNILLGPMMCGIYLCLFQRFRGEKVEFEKLFKGFDYFVESLIATLILTISVLVFIVPMSLIIFFSTLGIHSSGSSSASIFGSILVLLLIFLFLMVLGLVIGVLFCFTFPLIVDRGMKAIPALKTSFRAAIANWGGLFCLILLGMVLSSAAAIFCYLPVFLVAPITMGSIVIAYRRVFPEKSESEEPGIPEPS